MDERAQQIARAATFALKTHYGEGIVIEVERAIAQDGRRPQRGTYIPIEPHAELALFICACAMAAAEFVRVALSKGPKMPTQDAVERDLRLNVAKPSRVSAADQQRIISQTAEQAGPG